VFGCLAVRDKKVVCLCAFSCAASSDRDEVIELAKELCDSGKKAKKFLKS
jgi:hypothetical protein